MLSARHCEVSPARRSARKNLGAANRSEVAFPLWWTRLRAETREVDSGAFPGGLSTRALEFEESRFEFLRGRHRASPPAGPGERGTRETQKSRIHAGGRCAARLARDSEYATAG